MNDDDWNPDDVHGEYCECEDCRYERAEFECGMRPPHLGGGCSLAGTEHCDFDCLIRIEFERES